MPTDVGLRNAYVSEVLALDPAVDLERIIALRRRFLEGARGPALSERRRATGTVETEESVRERADRILTGIREGFWNADRAQTQARLIALDLEELPDLARYRDRLLLVTELREDADELLEHPEVDESFASALRAILVAPERIAVQLRQRYIQSSTRGSAISTNKRALRAVRAEYPELHELEKPWFKKISSAKKDRKDSRALRGGLGCIGIYFLIKLGAYVIGAIAKWLEGS